MPSHATIEKTPALVVNGGGSQTSNLSGFARGAAAFHALVGGTLLSAGGSGTPTVERTRYGLVRDEAGRLALSPSTKEPPSKPADFVTVAESLRELASLKSKAITLFFTGHGTPAGLVLWGGGILSPQFFGDWLKSLPEKTIVQAVFVMDHADRMLAVFENRKNKCALAVVRSWRAELKDGVEPSLAGLKKDARTGVYLTSERFGGIRPRPTAVSAPPETTPEMVQATKAIERMKAQSVVAKAPFPSPDYSKRLETLLAQAKVRREAWVAPWASTEGSPLEIKVNGGKKIDDSIRICETTPFL